MAKFDIIIDAGIAGLSSAMTAVKLGLRAALMILKRYNIKGIAI